MSQVWLRIWHREARQAFQMPAMPEHLAHRTQDPNIIEAIAPPLLLVLVPPPSSPSPIADGSALSGHRFSLSWGKGRGEGGLFAHLKRVAMLPRTKTPPLTPPPTSAQRSAAAPTVAVLLAAAL